MASLKKPSVLIRGVGEIASAVAHFLHHAGANVALQASRPPITIRRAMAFSDAVFDGWACLNRVTARRVRNTGLLLEVWAKNEIPLAFVDFACVINGYSWDVLVDSRMNKQSVPECQIGMAPLVIGMGPSCTIGDNVDVAVETSWDALGVIVRQGKTLPMRGEPRAILGYARERFQYAPIAGTVRAVATIGQIVRAGDMIAWIDDAPIVAAFDGIVRGLTHDGVPVERGNKIAEVDPRLGSVCLGGIDERPRRIAEAVTIIVGEHFPALQPTVLRV